MGFKCGEALLLTFLFLGTFFYAEGLKCHNCTYQEGKFEKDCGKKKLVECEKDQLCTAEKYGSPDGKWTGGILNCQDNYVGEDCYLRETWEFKHLTCQCPTDGCNSDPKNNQTLCTSCAKEMRRGVSPLLTK